MSPAVAVVAPDVRARLERLTRLPHVTFIAGLTFDPAGGFRLILPDGAHTSTIARLQEEIEARPGDPTLLLRLARLWNEQGDRAAAERALNRAAELYRRQGVEESTDPDLLTGYGEIRLALGQPREAEHWLRRAVQADPEQALARAALARALSARALFECVPSLAGLPPTDWASVLFSDRTPVHPEASHFAEARQQMNEAVGLTEEAVQRAGDRAETHRARAVVRTNRRLLEELLARSEAPAPRRAPLARALCHPDIQEALLRAAESTPDSPTAWGVLALHTTLASACAEGDCRSDAWLGRDLWNRLPDTARGTVQVALNRLEHLGQLDNPVPASAALGIRGLLQFLVLGDTAGGVSSLRRATALDPDNGQAWETLNFALAFSEQHEALLEVCRRRVEHRDTARNRLLLAKALERLRRFDDLLEETLLAQQLHPEDLWANLTLGAALLRVEPTAAARARALQALSKAGRLAGDRPDPELAVELLYQRGLWFALEGQAKTARQQFVRLLELAPGHPEATEALRLLDQWSRAD